jgi:hypothetical protein
MADRFDLIPQQMGDERYADHRLDIRSHQERHRLSRDEGLSAKLMRGEGGGHVQRSLGLAGGSCP